MAAVSLVAYLASDLTLEVDGLQNTVSSSYINDAVVTVTITVASTGAEVSGQSWPETLDYVAASNGKYRCTLQDTIAFANKTAYVAVITAIGDGLQRTWRAPVVGMHDTGGDVSDELVDVIAAKAGLL